MRPLNFAFRLNKSWQARVLLSRLLSVLLLGFLLQACGQKGDLYLPVESAVLEVPETKAMLDQAEPADADKRKSSERDESSEALELNNDPQ